jgi:hypothetical protein
LLPREIKIGSEVEANRSGNNRFVCFAKTIETEAKRIRFPSFIFEAKKN